MLGVLQALGVLRQALVRRGDELHANGGALDDVRAGRAGTSNRWWDSRCSWGQAARRWLCARAPPDFAELLAGIGMPPLPIRQPLRPPATGATPPSAADLPPRAAELLAAQFDTVAAAAEECDAPVPTGVMPTGAWR